MKNKSFLRYIIELFIVIVGVTIAFWLNTRAETSKENQTLENYYAELQADLTSDQRSLQFNIEKNEEKRRRMGHALGFYSHEIPNRDSIFLYSTEIGSYHFFEPTDITYRTMINSGDLKLINDFDVKKKLTRLYDRYSQIENLQENHLQAMDQNFFPKFVYMVDYATGEVLIPIEKEILVKNYFAFSANELGAHIAYYKSALKINQQLDSLIQQKL